jgi:flagellar basal-body rod modification protein FlgD
MESVSSVLNAARPASSDIPKESLGKDDFFRLLATQLGNQDPMDPVDNREMIAQLAQFTTLEQMTGINERLDLLHSAAAAQINGSVVNLLGDKIWYEGHKVDVTQEKPFEGSYELSGQASSVRVTVKNAQGEVVASWDEGAVNMGKHELHPEKSGQDVSQWTSGIYTVEIAAVDKDGKEVKSSFRSSGVVTGVSFEDGAPMLLIGDEKVEPANVIEVGEG